MLLHSEPCQHITLFSPCQLFLAAAVGSIQWLLLPCLKQVDASG